MLTVTSLQDNAVQSSYVSMTINQPLDGSNKALVGMNQLRDSNSQPVYAGNQLQSTCNQLLYANKDEE